MMKIKYFIYLPLVVACLFISSCGDKRTAEVKSAENESEVTQTEEVNSVNPEMDEQVEQIKEIQKQQEIAPIKEEEVRDVAGFAKYLRGDTELYINLKDLSGLIGAMRGSEIGKMLAELAKKEGDDIDEAMKTPEFKEFLNVAGEEVFISMGDGAGKSMRTIGDVYSIYYRMYFYVIGKFLVDAMDGGNLTNNPEAMIQTLLKPVFDELMEIEDYSLPKVIVGFKVSNESDRARYTQLIQETVAKALEFNEVAPQMKDLLLPDATDAYGGFKGVKIDYSKILESYENSPDAFKELEKMGLSKEYVQDYAEKFKDFKMTLLVGNYKDYVIIYLGDTSEGMEFVDEPSESLLAHDEMKFLKEYKGKEVISISYVSKEIDEELTKVSGMMEDLSDGVCKFLGETESLGDTKHIQALLQKMAENEKNLSKISIPSRFASVAYLEDGFKLDSFHGGDSSIYDLDAQRKLASIAMQADAVISSSWVVNEASSDLSIQGVEDFVNLAYQVTKLAVGYDTENQDFLEFCDMFKMLDGQFSDDLLTIWKAMKDAVQQGLGNEGAMVMDLKGKLPRLPDVPSVIIENGKIPRFAIGYDVVDRAQLVSSWEQIDAANKQIVSKIEQITNEKINYRKAELAKKEGIDFWSYQLGVTSHEVNLALGINDSMIFFTTSPAFVEGFVPLYDSVGKREGMDFKLRIAPMRELARDWMKLVDEHGEELSPTFDQAEFKESKIMIDKVLKVSEEIDSMDFSMRKINGEVRSFFHLNKRN